MSEYVNQTFWILPPMSLRPIAESDCWTCWITQTTMSCVVRLCVWLSWFVVCRVPPRPLFPLCSPALPPLPTTLYPLSRLFCCIVWPLSFFFFSLIETKVCTQRILKSTKKISAFFYKGFGRRTIQSWLTKKHLIYFLVGEELKNKGQVGWRHKRWKMPGE